MILSPYLGHLLHFVGILEHAIRGRVLLKMFGPDPLIRDLHVLYFSLPKLVEKPIKLKLRQEKSTEGSVPSLLFFRTDWVRIKFRADL